MAEKLIAFKKLEQPASNRTQVALASLGSFHGADLSWPNWPACLLFLYHDVCLIDEAGKDGVGSTGFAVAASRRGAREGNMATILQFRRAESTGEASPQLQTAIRRMAEVIIFPGVRIDRQPEKDVGHANPSPESLRPAQG